MNNIYFKKVELLLRLIPFIMEEQVFAVHGGSAINLFMKDMPRYSVDIDLTYIPLADREKSLNDINFHLRAIADKATSKIRGLHIVPNYMTCKLLCEYHGYQVKIEVNQTKRGIIGGQPQLMPLCEKAQNEFSMYCKALVVPPTLLYGGKIAAALSRQHPRDLFDVHYMDIPFDEVREGLLFCLLSSDRPIHESLAPKLIDQRAAMENQFNGMTETPFNYDDFEKTRAKLIEDVNALFTPNDKEFLLSFESAEPDWSLFDYPYFSDYPSVKWKLQNLIKLSHTNPNKFQTETYQLRKIFHRIT